MKEGLAENKVLILYLLNKLQDGIKSDNLYKIVSSANNMNYFYFQELLTDLIESNFVGSFTKDEDTIVKITSDGQNTLALTKSLLSGIVKLKADTIFKKEISSIAEQSSIITEYIPKDEKNYTVKCKIVEKNETIFEVSTFAIEGIYHLLMVCAFVLTVLLILGFCVIAYYLMPHHLVEGIELMYRCNLGFLIQKPLSNHFALLYYHCVRMGIPTRLALQMLKNCTSQPVICFLAEHVDNQLNIGNDLVEAVGIQYLDPSFQKLMKTIVLSASALNLLEGYLKVADVKRRKRMKQAGQLIQGIAYVFIAIMIVLVYQVLFLPLSMLERM